MSQQLINFGLRVKRHGADKNPVNVMNKVGEQNVLKTVIHIVLPSPSPRERCRKFQPGGDGGF